jgi:magnesium chelatase family protein
LLAVCAHLTGREPIAPLAAPSCPKVNGTPIPDLADVRGQAQAKRALTIAAAGAHSLLMIGPPGTGKSMLAQRLPGILPPLAEDEALASAAVASLAGRFSPATWAHRPYRAPHHTASAVALVGGGGDPRPGEISLAHHGVLFLDELPEWDRRVLEVLREPLESGVIHISRAARQSTFPAQFQLVAAMNPCPCGWLGHTSGRCHCTAEQIRYRGSDRSSIASSRRRCLALPRCLRSARRGMASQDSVTSAQVRGAVTAGATIRQGKPNARLVSRDRHALRSGYGGAALLARVMARLSFPRVRITGCGRSRSQSGVPRPLPHMSQRPPYRRFEKA